MSKTRKKNIKDIENGIRYIINDCELINGVPKDEFDCLTSKITSSLFRKTNQGEIASLIFDELRNHFGLSLEMSECNNIAKNIMTFWKEH